MLAKENFYLHEACVKGLKGGFDWIIGWYQQIFAHAEWLAMLV